MERPPRSEKRQRNELVPVRMTAAERRELEGIAVALGSSLSGLLRESALARRTEVAQLYPASA